MNDPQTPNALERFKIKALLDSTGPLERVRVMGWVRTKRDHREFAFLEVNDGSCLSNIQVVADAGTGAYKAMESLGTGAAVDITGELVESPGKGQKWEVRAGSLDILGNCPDDYPLQKKRHSDEFLRGIAHLRPRTNKYGAIFRIRASLSQAVHRFFSDRGFHYVHTPILTASDCEGAGEMFQVGTGADGAKTGREFFGRPAFLTVSGQLSGEMMALALGDIYTFGPTFRAENSHTARHAAEFWMIEPEMAFCDLAGNMDLAEEFIKALVVHTMDQCAEDLNLFARFVDKTLMQGLETVADSRFERVTYTQAVGILEKAKHKWQFPPQWGQDLQTEHERYLAETHFKKPVIVFDYPASIKPFYMRVNDDKKTVAAMDVLVPRVGEIIGGSQREERANVLLARMEEMGMDLTAYQWYMDSRVYGSAPHAGFGLGFERLLMMVTGVGNIRDVIPYPRTPGSMEY